MPTFGERVRGASDEFVTTAKLLKDTTVLSARKAVDAKAGTFANMNGVLFAVAMPLISPVILFGAAENGFLRPPVKKVK